jgi:hypothetical protein
MTKLVNRAKMTTATTGTGTLTLGSAVDGYQTFADAGVVDADVVRYVIEDGDAWEIGTGIYSDADATVLLRTVSESSNADAALNLTGNAVVFVSAAAADLQELVDFADNFVLPTADGSTGQVLTTNGAGTLSFTTITGYTDADVDTHLNTGTASSGEVLSWDGTDYDWIAVSGGATDIDGLSDGYSDGSSVGLGSGALANDDGTANLNTAVGISALETVTSGNRNSAFGNSALRLGASPSQSSAVGQGAGRDYTTQGGVFVGYEAGKSLTTATGAVAIGEQAAVNATTATRIIAIGAASFGSAVTTGTDNIGIGYQTGFDLTSGANNFLGGYRAGYDLTTGSNNVAIGNGALDAATTGGRNIAIGQDAMGLGVATAASGNNVALGYRAGYDLTSGEYNILIGNLAGTEITTASSNSFIGAGAGALATGPQNTILGAFAQNITTGSNNTLLGYGAAASSATVSNEITLGNSSITRFRVPGIQSGASDGDVLTYDATNGILSLQAAGGGGVAASNIQVFTSSGTYTPTAGTEFVEVILVGGGGAGGGGYSTAAGAYVIGSGGAGGNTVIAKVSVSDIGATATVTVGAGGAAFFAPSSGGNGSGGSASTFVGSAVSLSASGGGGGNGGFSSSSIVYSAKPPTSQSVPSGAYLILGGVGDRGAYYGTSGFHSGTGGSSALGFGPSRNFYTGTFANGVSGSAYGAGATGGSSVNASFSLSAWNGAGAAGVVIVKEYIA